MGKKVLTYVVIALTALAGALNYVFFVIPNSFAPAGLNGICTMIQYIFNFNMGYLYLIVNIPLAVIVFFKVSKTMALRSSVYIIFFSLGMIVFQKMDLSAFVYQTENGTSKILGPLTAGIIVGFVYSVLIRVNAYTGGTDFIAALIHEKYPNKSVFSLMFSINVIVAVISYFVYGNKIEPVLLCIIYTFASTTTGDRFKKLGRSAVRFEIITGNPEPIINDIINVLHHSATLMQSKGAYSGETKTVISCIVNNSQVANLNAILEKYPGTFTIIEPVTEVRGNFKKIASSGKPDVSILDGGDGKTK